MNEKKPKLPTKPVDNLNSKKVKDENNNKSPLVVEKLESNKIEKQDNSVQNINTSDSKALGDEH